jgi:hypothetical protein
LRLACRQVNTSNIKHVVPELFAENLIRGRGLFCRSIMKAQAASLPYTPVFAALVGIINTKMPQVGELLVTRLASQFRRAFKRNDKTVCIASASFIAHLVNQSVAHELLPLQIILLLQKEPTSDSLEIACALTREVGLFLTENSAKATNIIFERFRAILHEGTVDKRVQFMIEVLFQVRKDRFKDNPIMVEELDLVEQDEQITHRVLLDDELQVQEGLSKSSRLLLHSLVLTAPIYISLAPQTSSRPTPTSSRTRRSTRRSRKRFSVTRTTRAGRSPEARLDPRATTRRTRTTRPSSPTRTASRT